MDDHLYLYIVSVLAVVASGVLMLVLSLFTSQERAKMPAAVRFTNLDDRIRIGTERLAALTHELDAKGQERAAALLTIERAFALRQQVEDDQRLLLTLQTERREQVELQSQLVANRDAIRLQGEERERLASEVSRLRIDAEFLGKQRAATVEETNKAKTEAEAARAACSAAQMKRDQAQKAMSEAEAKSVQLGARVEQLNQDLEKLTGHLDAGRKQLEENEVRLRDVEGRRAAAELQYQQIEMRIKHEQEKLDAFFAQLDARKKQEQQATEQLIAAMERRREQMRTEIEADIDAIRKRAIQHGVMSETDTEKQLSDVWEPAIPARGLNTPQQGSDELARLDFVESYLRSLGLRFDQRVVYAFHTSLKIAREAPLLVLAGISGTGKSLLPKRYAEAMGINQLTVPVQPRWDSPQDLLGFYNHLQGKYVPTELLRALLQMDPHLGHRPALPGMDRVQQRADQMLLVLLDEMNLARVEYYFSDFLSVLENRPNIREPGDERQRRKAEVAIDLGASEGRELRLYVDTNVLFVGTMNEDESTQSLSDKVVDRANVMRFAAPHRFANDANGVSGEPKGIPDQFLPYRTWRSWHRSEGSAGVAAMEGKVDQWIDGVAKIMKEPAVDRAFGHRVQRAIKEYVAQYPRRDEIGMKWAMADQIEQRILPKLRGIEIHDREIRSLSRLVRGELGDVLLAEAIERGSEGGTPFVWRGVDRLVEQTPT